MNKNDPFLPQHLIFMHAKNYVTIFHLHQGVESGQPPLANSGDPIARKIAGLQKSLQRDKKQNEKEARKLRDENARLQREMADLSSAMGDARSKVGVLMLN